MVLWTEWWQIKMPLGVLLSLLEQMLVHYKATRAACRRYLLIHLLEQTHNGAKSLV